MRKVKDTGRRDRRSPEHHRSVQHPVHRQGQHDQSDRVQPPGLALASPSSPKCPRSTSSIWRSRR
ncbi:MAG: hypothetical protein M0C28_32135 [Candidatus Moduliflexus flocculans]|nr:hypothetical protein [Candidatus Moduliflexus flocculans]